MFGLSFGEVLIILVVALMVLGPSGMPKLARTLGKGLRDFRRATGELRGAFEEEFYQLDKSIEPQPQKPAGQAPAGATPLQAAVPVAVGGAAMATGPEALGTAGAAEAPGTQGGEPVASGERISQAPGTSGGAGPLVVAAADTVAVEQTAAVPDAEATPVVNPPAVNKGHEG